MKKILFILLATLSLSLNGPAVFAQKHKPHKVKHITKEVTVYVTRTGSKYHRDGCSYLRRSSTPISKSDAITSGYGACSRCNP